MAGLLKKTIKFAFYLWIMAFILSPVALAIWGIEEHPLVIQGDTMTYTHVNRLRQLMDTHDPRKMRRGETKTLVTREEEINLALAYGLSNRQQMAADVDIEPGYSLVRFTMGLQRFNLEGFLNITMRLALTEQSIFLERLKIGRIRFPDWMTRHLLLWIHRLATMDRDYRQLATTVAALHFDKDQLVMIYQWRPDLVKGLANRGRKLLSEELSLQRQGFYLQAIEDFAAEQPRISSIAPVMGKLFALAHDRSVAENSAPAENSALINALAHYISGSSYRQLLGVPEIDIQRKAARRYLLLAGRLDLTKHFVLSAFIANSAGIGVADAMGLFKEFRDSQGGSGFSFSDLAADKAGTRFAELATSPGAARQVQVLMMGIDDEAVFMPDVRQLPENIQELEFKSRYRSLESAEYQLIEAEIAHRLAACELYRPENGLPIKKAPGSEG